MVFELLLLIGILIFLFLETFEDTKALFGSLNIVCNNAGILSSKIEDTRKIIDLNLVNFFLFYLLILF